MAGILKESPLLASVVRRNLILLVPDDIAMQFVLEQTNNNLVTISALPIFGEVLRNHILLDDPVDGQNILNLSGKPFRYDGGKMEIDGVPILETFELNQVTIHLVGGMLATAEQATELTQEPPLNLGRDLPETKYDFMIEKSPLTDKQNKYCRCVLRVAAKGKVRLPYPVCAKSVGTTYKWCSKYYDYDVMDLNLLLAWLKLHDIDTTNIKTRERAVVAVEKWKRDKNYT